MTFSAEGRQPVRLFPHQTERRNQHEEPNRYPPDRAARALWRGPFAQPPSCSAADFPQREIQVIVGAAAGGLVDAAARNLAKPMEEMLGRPVVVVNKPGAGSALALTAIKNAKADGYTIGVNPGVAYTYDPHARKVDYTVEDFQYLAAVAQFQWAYVCAPDKPWKDFKGLVAHAKKNPGMAYATMHPVGENILKYVARKEGIQWRAIPTKGGAGGDDRDPGEPRGVRLQRGDPRGARAGREDDRPGRSRHQ